MFVVIPYVDMGCGWFQSGACSVCVSNGGVFEAQLEFLCRADKLILAGRMLGRCLYCGVGC